MMRRWFTSLGVTGRRKDAHSSRTPVYEHGDLTRRLQGRAQRFNSRHRTYRVLVMASMALSLALVTSLLRLDVEPAERTQGTLYADHEIVLLEEIQQTRQVERPPAPPRPPAPIEVPDDEVLEEEEFTFDAEIDFEEVAELPPPPVVEPPKVVAPEPEPEIFVVVEQMPELIGGLASLTDVLQYPDVARKAGISGTVIVQIVVDPEGMPRDPVVLRSASALLDGAAVEAVLKLRFVPGKQRGRPVPVRMAFPVRFNLIMV